jgi:RNA polymerase subunit RPABC4/transcription elongation factor Spt4
MLYNGYTLNFHSEGTLKMMYCKNCDKLYNEKMHYCVICGAELIDKAENAVNTVINTAAIAVTESVIPPEPPPNTPDSPNSPDIPNIPDMPDTPEIPEFPETPEQPPITAETPAFAESGMTVTPVSVRKISQEPFLKRAIAAVLSAIIGVCCFALFAGAALSYTARYVTYPDTVDGIINNVDILDLPIGETPVWAGEGKNTTVKEAVYTLSHGLGITDADIEALYEQTTFREDLSRVIVGYADYIRTGKIPDDITADDVKAVFTENLSYINAALVRSGAKALSERDVEFTLSQIDKTDGILRSLSVRSISGDGAEVGIFRTLISFPVIIAELLIAVLLIAAIGRINNNYRTPLKVGGIALCAAGFLIAAACFLIENQAVSLTANSALEMLITGAFGYIGKRVYIIGGAYALTGLLMAFISRYFNGRIISNEQEQAV